MILFAGGNLGVLFLSGTFVPTDLPGIARLYIYSRTHLLELTGRTWG